MIKAELTIPTTACTDTVCISGPIGDSAPPPANTITLRMSTFLALRSLQASALAPRGLHQRTGAQWKSERNGRGWP